MKVIKRDGTTVDFDGNKIVLAIQKANAAVEESERIDEDKIHDIVNNIQVRNRNRLLVEDIQDSVEHGLMEAGKFELAKQYICVYPFSSKLPSHPGCHITLSRVPCAIQYVLVGYPF